MSKIYKRPTLLKSKGAKKNEHNRARNVIINFRVTQEEKKRIEERIALSGLSKAEFFIQSTLHQKIEVYGNVRVYEQMREDMVRIGEAVVQLKEKKCLSPEEEAKLEMLCEMMKGWKTSERT